MHEVVQVGGSGWLLQFQHSDAATTLKKKATSIALIMEIEMIQKTRHACFAGLLSSLLLLNAGNASAVVMTTGCANATTCTAPEMNNGGTITVDELLFQRTGSTFISSGGADTVFPDESMVTITGNDGTVGMPTLNWDDNLQHFANDGDNHSFSFITYTFDIVIAAGFEIFGTTVVLTPNIFTTDDAQVTANLRVGGNNNEVIIMGASPTGQMPTLPDQNMISFGPLTGTVQASLFLQTQMINSDGSDFGGIELVDTIFKTRRIQQVQIPEPGTLALFGLGLAGLGFARRRKAA